LTAIFVDSGAFLALSDRTDGNHRPARGFVRRLSRQRRPLVTSTYVFAEVVTFVRVRVGYDAAVALGERLLQSEWCRILEISDETRAAASQIFVRYRDQRFSFVDCTSFALMRAMGITEAFTFDRRDYAVAGLIPLPA
jgi:uncharacterized protein